MMPEKENVYVKERATLHLSYAKRIRHLASLAKCSVTRALISRSGGITPDSWETSSEPPLGVLDSLRHRLNHSNSTRSFHSSMSLNSFVSSSENSLRLVPLTSFSSSVASSRDSLFPTTPIRPSSKSYPAPLPPCHSFTPEGNEVYKTHPTDHTINYPLFQYSYGHNSLKRGLQGKIITPVLIIPY